MDCLLSQDVAPEHHDKKEGKGKCSVFHIQAAFPPCFAILSTGKGKESIEFLPMLNARENL